MTTTPLESITVDRRRLERRINPSRGIAVVLSVTLAVLVTVATIMYKSDTGPAKQPLLVGFGVIGLAIAALLMLSDIRFGIGIFTLMACVSPRFGANVRGEDLLVPILLAIWFWRIIRGGKFVLWTPITKPLVLVTVTMVLSLLWGLTQDTIPRPMFGLFIVAKRLEYAFLFFVALNSIQSREAGRALLATFLAGAVLASVIALVSATADASVGDTRATGLDEDNYNTFAGFLVLAISLAVAGAFQYRSRLGLAFGAAALLLTVTLIKSYSREGYFILFASLLTLGLIRYRALIPLLILAAALAPFVAPESVMNRVNDAVGEMQTYQTADPGENSVAVRISGWVWRWQLVEQQPILGNGPGSIELQVDNEYLLRLVEGGVIGLSAFLLLLVSCGRYLVICARRLHGTESEPFVYGLLAAFVGTLIQGMAAASWSTIRNMEPFWILMGALGGLVVSQSYRNQAASGLTQADAVRASA